MEGDEKDGEGLNGAAQAPDLVLPATQQYILFKFSGDSAIADISVNGAIGNGQLEAAARWFSEYAAAKTRLTVAQQLMREEAAKQGRIYTPGR